MLASEGTADETVEEASPPCTPRCTFFSLVLTVLAALSPGGVPTTSPTQRVLQLSDCCR